MYYDEILNPAVRGYTVYSKSGCLHCVTAKKMLEKHIISYVMCDEYLLKDRMDFLLTMNYYALREVTMFPMIFYDGDYIGGLKELKLHLESNP